MALGFEMIIRYFYHKAQTAGPRGAECVCGTVWMKRIIGTVFAVFLALVLFFVMLPVLILPVLVTGQKKPEIPSLAVLELDLGGTFTDQPQGSSFDTGRASSASIIRVVEALARAEDDARVSGLFVTLDGEETLPIAQAEEIRDALKSFRAKGKFVIVHARSFQPASLGAYYAATESDELWMQPGGTFASSDVQVNASFAEALANTDESASSGGQYEDYKTAVRSFTRRGLSGPNRDAYGSLVQAIHDRATEGIAISRGMSPDGLRALLQEGPRDAADALASGLISHLGPFDQARSAALIRAGQGATGITWSDYLAGAGTLYGQGAVIAVVYAEGPIKSDQMEDIATPTINANITANAIRDAADDESVKAILFRVDSAGGSAVASGQIWDAVKYASDSGKPVVVSMGSVAASGGYYVAMAADRIIAQPTTITGSIGVVDGKFVMGRSYGTLGLTLSETVAGGPGEQKNGLSDVEAAGGSGESWQTVNKVLGNFYTDFTLKVAEGRGMSLEAVHEVASGRAWSGAQARDLGLIDGLGGFRYAIGETKTMIGLDANAPVELRVWPGPASPWQRIMQMKGVSGSAGRVILMFSQLGQVETIKDLMGSVYNGAAPDEGPVEAE